MDEEPEAGLQEVASTKFQLYHLALHVPHLPYYPGIHTPISHKEYGIYRRLILRRRLRHAKWTQHYQCQRDLPISANRPLSHLHDCQSDLHQYLPRLCPSILVREAISERGNRVTEVEKNKDMGKQERYDAS